MKTSNKILLAFLIIVFATPVFLFLSFRNKIEKGQLTTSDHSGKQYGHTGAVAPFKIVKIVGPDAGVFSCHLIPSDSSWYGYNNYRETDSIKVEQKGDTLLVIYINTDIKKDLGLLHSELVHLRIDLHAPVINNVVAKGASVVMDTVDAAHNPEIFFDLHGDAHLKLGIGGHIRTITTQTRANGQVQESTVTEYGDAMFNKVTVRASSARVDLGKNAIVKDLHLQLQGTSSLSIHKNSNVGQLNGSLSDSSTVEANWKNIRGLVP